MKSIINIIPCSLVASSYYHADQFHLNKWKWLESVQCTLLRCLMHTMVSNFGYPLVENVN